MTLALTLLALLALAEGVLLRLNDPRPGEVRHAPDA